MDFLNALDELLATSEVVIDRPGGSTHHKHRDSVHPLDYRYLRDTHAGDGSGIDAFRGSAPGRGVGGVYVTIDSVKRDLEAKVLIDCTDEEVTVIGRFLHAMGLSPHLLPRT